jgi:hypothetical protein
VFSYLQLEFLGPSTRGFFLFYSSSRVYYVVWSKSTYDFFVLQVAVVASQTF